MLHRIVPPNNTNNLSSELDQLVDLAELELLSDTAKSLLKEEDNSNTSFQTQESIFIAIAGMNMGGFGSMPPMGGGQDGMPDFGATSGGMGGLPAMGDMGGFGGGMPPHGWWHGRRNARTCVRFQNLHLLPLAQRPEDFPDAHFDLTGHSLSTKFRRKYDMALAIPSGV